MITIDFDAIKYTHRISGVWQWDLAQKITINGNMTGCSVQWFYYTLVNGTTDNRDFALLPGKDDLETGGIVDIPDAALEQSGDITGYIYQNIDGVCETIGKIIFMPVARPMPDDYVSLNNLISNERRTPIVDTLPLTAPDGTEVIVREIVQNYSMLTMTKTFGLLNYLNSNSFPHVYFKKSPLKPNFTSLGIAEQLLISGITMEFGNNADGISLETSIYNILYSPVGFLPVDTLTFNDLTFEGYIDEGRIKYIYTWETFEIEFGNLIGWNEITEWDEENSPIASVSIPEMPPILAGLTFFFEDSAAGQATKTYFETIVSPYPYIYRRYIRDGGEWILLI